MAGLDPAVPTGTVPRRVPNTPPPIIARAALPMEAGQTDKDRRSRNLVAKRLHAHSRIIATKKRPT